MRTECPDLFPVLAELARRAWKSIKVVASRLYDLVRPPDDLRVSSTQGYEYTGVVVVDHNEIEGGAVARAFMIRGPMLESGNSIPSSPALV